MPRILSNESLDQEVSAADVQTSTAEVLLDRDATARQSVASELAFEAIKTVNRAMAALEELDATKDFTYFGVVAGSAVNAACSLTGIKRTAKRMAAESMAKHTAESMLGELVDLKKTIRQQRNLAQEGFGDRLINAFKRIGTSNESVMRDLPDALNALQTKGGSGTVITDPAWGRIFGTSSKAIDHSTAKKCLDDIRSFLEKAHSATGEVTRQSQKAGKMASSNETDADVKIEQIADDLGELVDKVHAAEPVFHKKAVEAQALDHQSAKVLVDAYAKAYTEFSHDSYFKDLKETCDAIEKLVKQPNLDKSVKSSLETILHECLLQVFVVYNDLFGDLHLIGYGILMWIKASTVK